MEEARKRCGYHTKGQGFGASVEGGEDRGCIWDGQTRWFDRCLLSSPTAIITLSNLEAYSTYRQIQETPYKPSSKTEKRYFPPHAYLAGMSVPKSRDKSAPNPRPRGDLRHQRIGAHLPDIAWEPACCTHFATAVCMIRSCIGGTRDRKVRIKAWNTKGVSWRGLQTSRNWKYIIT